MITYIFQNTCDHVMPCKVPCTTLKQEARLLVSTGQSEEGSWSRSICQGREFVWGDLGAVLVRPGRGRCEWSGGRRPKNETGGLVGGAESHWGQGRTHGILQNSLFTETQAATNHTARLIIEQCLFPQYFPPFPLPSPNVGQWVKQHPHCYHDKNLKHSEKICNVCGGQLIYMNFPPGRGEGYYANPQGWEENYGYL